MLHKLWGGPPGPRGSPWTRCLHSQMSPMRSARGRRGRRPRTGGSAPQSTQNVRLWENYVALGFSLPPASAGAPRSRRLLPAKMLPKDCPAPAQVAQERGGTPEPAGWNQHQPIRRDCRGRESLRPRNRGLLPRIAAPAPISKSSTKSCGVVGASLRAMATKCRRRRSGEKPNSR